MIELDQFVEATLSQYPTLWSEYDPTWRSPCQVGELRTFESYSAIPWRPTPRNIADDFAQFEEAIETTIHPSIKQYFGAYWSGCLEATSVHGHVSLILLWNEEDRDRFLENLIGHVLAQRRYRLELSVFFACTTPNSRLFLTVNNATGEVQLERPAYKAEKIVASNLAEFISELTPAPPYLHPERMHLESLYSENSLP
ncbi:MAG: SecY-interacting protein Syd [Gammaproteobacteria bacterium]|nr:SecY-interacting protein Syd [Gammaproteobacteria bacterium]MXX95699.1 SecY-interacting protein Syd [Gammaproteobacteria bacterium]MYF53316.1 SecY-interacting protein Syd [Gammaproteobacteria bacterium]MYK44444.1 SecY-interacting protein Syd [Gammaproteobacteria bacterium]